MLKRIFPTLMLLSAGALVFALPQPLMFLSGFLQAFFLPGIVFMAFVMNNRISRADHFFYSILLSPILLTILVVSTTYLAGDIYSSARIVLSGLYVLFIIALLTRRYGDFRRDVSGVPWQILILAFGYGSLILLSYKVNGYLLIRSDSWYHAAVVQEVINRGIPPGEPLLADYSIKYMWFYHVFQAVWIKLSGLGLFNAMGFFNIINAVVFPYMIAKYARYFTVRKGVIIFVAVLALAGLDAVSWIFWPVSLLRMFTGDVTGMAELGRILSNININGAAVINFLTPTGTWNINFSDKFLTITIFNYTFNLLLLTAIVCLRERFLKSQRISSAIFLFVVVLGTFLFHIVAGITLLFVIVGSGILMYISSHIIYGDKRSLRDFAPLFIIAFLVALAAFPYFRSLTSGGSGTEGTRLMSDRFHFGYRNMLTIILPLAILFFPARNAYKKLLSGRDQNSRMLIMWITCLLVLSLFINIGIVGEKKFIYFLFLIIGPPIYVEIAEKFRSYSGKKRIFMVAALLVLFIIPPFMTFRGFIMETPRTEMGSRRYYITDDDRSFFKWIDDNTSKESVIIENNINHLSPVYAGRRNLYSWYYVVKGLKYGGEDLELYKEIQNSLYGESELSINLIAKIKNFNRKLYITVWWDDIEKAPWLARRFNKESEWFDEVYSSGRVSLYSLSK